MSFLEWFGTMPSIDSAIQTGRGVAAAVIGQPYNVYRLSTQNQSIVSGTPLYTNFPVRPRRITQRDALENEVFALLCYNATCDNTLLQLGDVLVETGYEAQESAVFTFAQRRPTRETLFMRTEASAAIARPTPGAGNPAQQPASGYGFIDAYGGTSGATDAVLTLNDGVYSFSTTSGAQPATVMCGIQQLNRVRAAKDLGTPTDQPEARFLIYVPDLGGEQLQELDRIKLQNGDSYQVDSIYPAVTGLIGYITVCMKRGVA